MFFFFRSLCIMLTVLRMTISYVKTRQANYAGNPKDPSCILFWVRWGRPTQPCLSH